MSDALTDLERDVDRGRKFEDMIKYFYEFLSNPTDDGRTKVIEASLQVDSIYGGYWSGQTDYHSYINEFIDALLQNDERSWINLLKIAYDVYPYKYRLKEISPFKDQVLIFVDYGSGFVTIDGEIKSEIDRVIRDKGMKTYDCDDYVVSIPKDSFDKAKVHWMDCGISGVNGPRIYDKDLKKYIQHPINKKYQSEV